MNSKTIEINKVRNRYNDYLDCNFCNNEIEVNVNYFILYHDNQNYLEFVICDNDNDCLDRAKEYIINEEG